MSQLHFLLGSVRCVGSAHPDGREPAMMMMRTVPTMGGHYLHSEGTWRGVSIGRIFGWHPMDEVFTEYFFADLGGTGNATSPGWQNDQLVLTGSFNFAGVGERRIRDVFSRIDEDNFTIESQSWTGTEWRTGDRFTCQRYETVPSPRQLY